MCVFEIASCVHVYVSCYTAFLIVGREEINAVLYLYLAMTVTYSVLGLAVAAEEEAEVGVEGGVAGGGVAGASSLYLPSRTWTLNSTHTKRCVLLGVFSGITIMCSVTLRFAVRSVIYTFTSVILFSPPFLCSPLTWSLDVGRLTPLT